MQYVCPSYPDPGLMALGSCVQNVFARFTVPITPISSKAAGNPGFPFQITSPQGAENSWVVAGLEYQSLGFPSTLCYSFPTIPRLSLVLLMHISAPPNLLFKTHFHVLAEPHSSWPTHHPSQIPAKSCLTACAAHKASCCSNGPWQQIKAACPSASIR